MPPSKSKIGSSEWKNKHCPWISYGEYTRHTHMCEYFLMKVTMLSARAVCVVRLVSTDDSRTERLCKLLTASNSRRYIACTSGFHTEGGDLEFPPPPPQPQFSLPRILEIEYGYYISYLHVTEPKYVSSKCSEIFVPDCVRSNLRGIWNQTFPGGACPQTPHYYHPATILYESLCILYPAIIDVCRLPKEMNTATK